jgi:hypothetical protein
VNWESLACSPAEGIGAWQCPPVLPPYIDAGPPAFIAMPRVEGGRLKVLVPGPGGPSDTNFRLPEAVGLLPGSKVVLEYDNQGTPVRVPYTLAMWPPVVPSGGWVDVGPEPTPHLTTSEIRFWLGEEVPEPVPVPGLPKAVVPVVVPTRLAFNDGPDPGPAGFLVLAFESVPQVLGLVPGSTVGLVYTTRDGVTHQIDYTLDDVIGHFQTNKYVVGPSLPGDVVSVSKFILSEPPPSVSGGHASAFTVYGYWSCSPVGFTPEQAQQRATEHLLAYEEARVERALWTGDLDNEPSLKGAPDLLSGGSLPIVQALAVLEDHLAAHYGSLGVIHLTRGAALQGLAEDALHVAGGRLLTALDTPVVAGAGYPGTGPNGEPTGGGFSWAYVTPSLMAYRSDVFTSSNRPGDLLDRATNDMYAVAERQYLLGFDPCGTAAVRLALLP